MEVSSLAAEYMLNSAPPLSVTFAQGFSPQSHGKKIRAMQESIRIRSVHLSVSLEMDMVGGR
jgi:hypothetical protein